MNARNAVMKSKSMVSPSKEIIVEKKKDAIDSKTSKSEAF